MSGEWNWLCKTHLNEAEDGGCVKEKEPALMDVQDYFCDVKGCGEHNASLVRVSSVFWYKEVET